MSGGNCGKGLVLGDHEATRSIMNRPKHEQLLGQIWDPAFIACHGAHSAQSRLVTIRCFLCGVDMTLAQSHYQPLPNFLRVPILIPLVNAEYVPDLLFALSPFRLSVVSAFD